MNHKWKVNIFYSFFSITPPSTKHFSLWQKFRLQNIFVFWLGIHDKNFHFSRFVFCMQKIEIDARFSLGYFLYLNSFFSVSKLVYWFWCSLAQCWRYKKCILRKFLGTQCGVLGKFNFEIPRFVFRDRYLLFFTIVGWMEGVERSWRCTHSIWLRALSPIENHDEWLLE